MKKQWIAFIVFALMVFNAKAQYAELYSGFSKPESIASDGQFLYISDIGTELNPGVKDGDGSIHKLSLDGKLVAQNITKEVLDAPLGLTVVGNLLYVIDVNRVLSIDLSSGKKVNEIDLSRYGTKLLNDIAFKDANTFFVSDTNGNTMFQITLGKQPVVEEIKLPELMGPNGIEYDKSTNRLYVVGLDFNAPNGTVGYLSWKGKQASFTKLSEVKGYYDGIQLLDANTLLVTDWVALDKPSGVLRKINLKDGTHVDLPLDVIAGPADVYYMKKNKTLYIPCLVNGDIMKYKF